MGSPLASLAGVPMMLGPLNGGLPWPRDYPELRRQEREWLVPLRRAYKLLPYYRATYRHLAAVISGSRHTATEVPPYFQGQRFYLPENGIDTSRLPIAAVWPEPRGRFRFLTVGRLVPYKGVDLILQAMRSSSALAPVSFARGRRWPAAWLFGRPDPRVWPGLQGLLHGMGRSSPPGSGVRRRPRPLSFPACASLAAASWWKRWRAACRRSSWITAAPESC